MRDHPAAGKQVRGRGASATDKKGLAKTTKIEWARKAVHDMKIAAASPIGFESCGICAYYLSTRGGQLLRKPTSKRIDEQLWKHVAELIESVSN